MKTRFAHAMPWGAQRLDGGARFRLWAPGQRELALVADEHALPMRKAEDGWFELETDAINVGDAYAFRLSDGMRVPDPAARAQLGDVHGPSRLVDPLAYEWQTPDWRGRPWEEAVIYELHTGTFTPDGTFNGVCDKLDHLSRLGVTAIELMPVAQFSGTRGWGYDGVLLYAPHTAYGGPEGLKRLVDAAHERGLMVLLDVVYNHFGPDGNYLHLYASDFFNADRHTPWGAAIAFHRRPVRDFFIHNALYWLEEFRFDGLRLDAIDQIADETDEPILEEMATAIREHITDREIHLTTEDDRNITSLLPRDADGRPRLYTAEWNDDWHHAAHVLLTGEEEGYYEDYQEQPALALARAMAEGFTYQGEPSPFRDGKARGEPSAHLPPTAFIDCVQNHDQIGNRAFGDRITNLAEPQAVEAALSLLVLSPQIPLLYMGEEWAERRPFLFFASFEGDLAEAVRKGRRNEFAKWSQFRSAKNRDRIPDPNAPQTFDASKLDWSALETEAGAARFAFLKRLLALRARTVAPLLVGAGGHSGETQMLGASAFCVRWTLAGGAQLAVRANLSRDAADTDPAPAGGFEALHETPQGADAALAEGRLAPWSVVWRLQRG